MRETYCHHWDKNLVSAVKEKERKKDGCYSPFGTSSVVGVTAIETKVDLTDELSVASLTPTSITVEIGEGTTASDQTLTYEVTVNGETTETVTGTTNFETTFTFSSTTLSLSFSSRETTITFNGQATTEINIPAGHTIVTVNGVETSVELPGLTTILTASGSTNVALQLPEVTTEVVVTEETYAFTWQTYQIGSQETDKSSCDTYSLTAAAGETSDYCVPGLTTTIVLPTGATESTVSLYGASLQTTIALPGTTTTFIPEQSITVVKDGSTETSIIPAVVSSYVTTISDTTVPSSEESSASEESTTESTSESTISEESSITSGESSTISGTPSTATIPAPTPTANPTYCEVVRGPLTPEEEVQLKVLFSDRAGASAFADYVVSYASQLVAQIADVANVAVGDNNYAFTTAFNTIDIPGVLGLASAAPIYTCFLSTLWAQALSNPQQYAKRAVPTQDEKIKLIVLFEKRENSGLDFDYAELLVDETNDLIAEVQNVSAAAANGNLGAYASLFANVDVPYFLSIATEAPIYTEGLSAALQTALASYSESVFRPTVTTMTTRTYTTVNTIVTNFVNGTVTVPTTIVSTETVVTVEPVGQVQATSTALQAAPAPAPTANAPVNKVTTEVVTLGNGRVETRTVTICVENCDIVVAESTRRPAAVQTVTTRPNVAVYTQVQNGVTYTHTIEIQTKNAALKKVAALGAGILGGAALLL